MITVFTPAYNRAHLLPRLFESLCKQTFKDFEWVVVDDGSTDDTKSLTLSLSNREGTWFPVRYFYQENGGKHRAINRGVKEAKGELFFIVDSDDLLFPYSLEIVDEEYKSIKDDKSFCGICGMKGYSSNIKVGTQIRFGHLDCTIMESSYKYHIYGDKAEVIKTEIFRKFPFPEYENEKFCPEALVWNRMSKYYRIRYFDKIIYQCEYLPDGLTSKISKLLERNIKSTMLTYKEMNEFEAAPMWFKVRSAINFYRYTLLKSFRCHASFRLKTCWIWTLPLGFFSRLIKG